MSPEQCRGEPLDRRSDIFALGIVLYEMTTGTRLFNGDNEFAVLQQIAMGDIEPPSKRRPDYPPELERIVMASLQREREDRLASGQVMQAALEAFALEHRINTSPLEVDAYMRRAFAETIDAEESDATISRKLRGVGAVRAMAASPDPAADELDLDAPTTARAIARPQLPRRLARGSTAVEPLVPASVPRVAPAAAPVSPAEDTASAPVLSGAAAWARVRRSRASRLALAGAVVLGLALAAAALLDEPTTARPPRPPAAPITERPPALYPHLEPAVFEGASAPPVAAPPVESPSPTRAASQPDTTEPAEPDAPSASAAVAGTPPAPAGADADSAPHAAPREPARRERRPSARQAAPRPDTSASEAQRWDPDSVLPPSF